MKAILGRNSVIGNPGVLKKKVVSTNVSEIGGAQNSTSIAWPDKSSVTASQTKQDRSNNMTEASVAQ